MRHEIDKHWGKLRKMSKLSESQLEESRLRIFSRISFINEELIPGKIWLDAEKIATDIDIDDSDFIALTKHLKGYLWTGDKQLYIGLKNKKFKKVFNTSELITKRKSGN